MLSVRRPSSIEAATVFYLSGLGSGARRSLLVTLDGALVDRTVIAHPLERRGSRAWIRGRSVDSYRGDDTTGDVPVNASGTGIVGDVDAVSITHNDLPGASVPRGRGRALRTRRSARRPPPRSCADGGRRGPGRLQRLDIEIRVTAPAAAMRAVLSRRLQHAEAVADAAGEVDRGGVGVVPRRAGQFADLRAPAPVTARRSGCRTRSHRSYGRAGAPRVTRSCRPVARCGTRRASAATIRFSINVSARLETYLYLGIPRATAFWLGSATLVRSRTRRRRSSLPSPEPARRVLVIRVNHHDDVGAESTELPGSRSSG